MRRLPLEPRAERFIQTLAVRLKPSSCQCYRGYLRRLLRWLDDDDDDIEQLDRRQCIRWFHWLKDQGLKQETRIHTIALARSYLRWLNEQGLLANHPDALIRPTDFPKRPHYLPRPISPRADRELRARLQRSSCRYQQALLLMRNTGMRIGELMALPRDCLRVDLRGNHFVKVPLGKLDNERLVPVDAKTVELVVKLQTTHRQEHVWLVESPWGKKTHPRLYREALRQACQGIDIDGPMTSHRLRHTFATTMISGGMSLVGVMKLLGHLSYKTTLRYADITQETVGREYAEAPTQLEKRYQRPLHGHHLPRAQPSHLLADLIRWVQKHIAHEQGHHRAARRLIKRIQRIDTEIQRLMPRGTSE